MTQALREIATIAERAGHLLDGQGELLREFQKHGAGTVVQAASVLGEVDASMDRLAEIIDRHGQVAQEIESVGERWHQGIERTLATFEKESGATSDALRRVAGAIGAASQRLAQRGPDAGPTPGPQATNDATAIPPPIGRLLGWLGWPRRT